MPPELRKRKVAAEPVATPPAKRTGPVGKAVEKVKNALSSDKKSTKAPDHATVGQIINLDGFGGDIETNDGEKTTFKQLVDKSIAGVVLFTYPKASTPGCKNTPFHFHHVQK
jgi:peroxiredoxin Q/BCP